MSVYVIGNEANALVKVGHSRYLARRLSELQCGSPVRLTFLGAFPGDGALERTLHLMLKPRRAHGEWFDVKISTVELALMALDRGETPEAWTARMVKHSWVNYGPPSALDSTPGRYMRGSLSSMALANDVYAGQRLDHLDTCRSEACCYLMGSQ